MSILFSKMVGTLAVIIVIAAFIGGSDLFGKFFGTEEKWKYILIAGLLGGAEFIRSKACFVLAGMEGMKYRKESLDLKHGDKLFMYTDGVTEAENEFHELFTEKRLQTCLTNIKKADPDTIIKRIRSDITSHVHGSEQFDDITMLCIKYN